MTEDEIRELLREMSDDPVPAESLRRVRIGVAERTRPRMGTWRWTAAALAASACVVLLVLWLREPAPVRKPTPPVIALNPVVPTKEPAPIPVPQSRKPKPPIRAVARPDTERAAAPEANFVIRIDTPDPDVLILLIGD